MLDRLIGQLPKHILDRPQFTEPLSLVSIGLDVFEREQFLIQVASNAWQSMRHQARLDGVELQVVSAFRSVAYQQQIIEKKLSQGQSLAEIVKVSALPGYSEHHSGCALDITTPEEQGVLSEAFEQTQAFQWLSGNAGAYGFTMSYPRDNPHGYIYEPWHWCYRQTEKSH